METSNFQRHTYKKDHCESRLCFMSSNKPLEERPGRESAVDQLKVPNLDEDSKNKVIEFVDNRPKITAVLRTMQSIEPDLKDENVKREWVKEVIDHKNWLQLIQHPDLSKKEIRPFDIAGDGRQKVLSLLMSLQPDERNDVMQEYIQKYIPQHIQQGNDFRQMVAGKDDQDRMKSIATAMSGILGEKDAFEFKPEEQDAKKVAIASLQDHYADVQRTPNSRIKPSGVLDYDLRQTIKELEAKKIHVDRGTSPQMILDAGITNPRLKGAMKLGAIDDQRLQSLRDEILKTANEKGQVTGSVARKLDAMRAVTQRQEREVKKEAMDLSNMWKQSNGIEKFAILAAGGALLVAAYNLVKKAWDHPIKAALLVAMGGGAYVWWKNKYGESPVYSTWKKGTGLGDRFTDWSSPPDSGIDPVARANQAVQFLGIRERRNLETEATGFGVMLDVPLQDLAKGMIAQRENIYEWDFNARPGTPLHDELLRTSANKFDPAKVREFFLDNSHVKDAKNGLFQVFYKIAADKPQNKDKAQDVIEGINNLRMGQDMDDFAQLAMSASEPQRKIFEKANDAYQGLVKQGFQECINGGVGTLGDYIRRTNLANMPALPQEMSNYENQQLLQMGSDIRQTDDIKAVGGKFQIQREGGSVLYGLDLKDTDVAESNLNDFIVTPAGQVARQYLIWRQHLKSNKTVTRDPFKDSYDAKEKAYIYGIPLI